MFSLRGTMLKEVCSWGATSLICSYLPNSVRVSAGSRLSSELGDPRCAFTRYQG